MPDSHKGRIPARQQKILQFSFFDGKENWSMCVSGGRQPELLAAASVATHELVYATGGVDELALTGVEGMRGRRDFELHYGIFFTFEDHSVIGLAGGTREEHVAVAHILEDNRAIIFGMDTLFHCFV